MKTHKIIDRQTQKQVGKDYKNFDSAWRRVDTLDAAHGGYRYFVKTITTTKGE